MSEALVLPFDSGSDGLTEIERSELDCREAIIERGLKSFIEVGTALLDIREAKLYRHYGTFDEYIQQRWPAIGRAQSYRLMEAASVTTNLKMSPIGDILPANEAQVRPLTTLKRPDEQREAWGRAQENAGAPERITARVVEEAVDEVKREAIARITISDRTQFIPLPSLAHAGTVPLIARLENAPKPHFNRTNDNVEWALWTWNPVTGCLHDCDYCYARDIANRFYPQGFVPTFHPERLGAPQFMQVPAAARDNIGEKNVFVCSMADLFGKWVPREWIEKILAEVVAAPVWNFLFLTKFPQRLCEFEWPANAWVGTTVDRQYRVDIAEKAFRKVTAGVKWLSCEPMLEPLEFSSLDMFDWVVVGGASRSSQTQAFQPDREWVTRLHFAALRAGCQWYEKPNLQPARVRQYPGA